MEPETNGRLNIPKDNPKKNIPQEILKQTKNSQPILEGIEVEIKPTVHDKATIHKKY